MKILKEELNMTNKCECSLKLDGKNISESDFENVILAINQERLCEQVIPVGHSLDPRVTPSCDLASENWGSKGGLYNSKVSRVDGTVIKAFGISAWNPPWAVFRKLAENGWGLNVKFVDESWNFVGQITHATSSNLEVYEEWQTSRPWFLKQQLKLSGVGSALINRKQLWEFGCIEQWMSAHKYKPSREERNRPLEEGIKVYRVQRSVLEKKKKVKTKLQKLDQTGG